MIVDFLIWSECAFVGDDNAEVDCWETCQIRWKHEEFIHAHCCSVCHQLGLSPQKKWNKSPSMSLSLFLQCCLRVFLMLFFSAPSPIRSLSRKLASSDGVVEANHGSCVMISWARVLPDLMMFLMAVPFLMIELPCLLASLMHVTGLVKFSFKALACLMTILVTVEFLKVVISSWWLMMIWFGPIFVQWWSWSVRFLRRWRQRAWLVPCGGVFVSNSDLPGDQLS